MKEESTHWRFGLNRNTDASIPIRLYWYGELVRHGVTILVCTVTKRKVRHGITVIFFKAKQSKEWNLCGNQRSKIHKKVKSPSQEQPRRIRYLICHRAQFSSASTEHSGSFTLHLRVDVQFKASYTHFYCSDSRPSVLYYRSSLNVLHFLQQLLTCLLFIQAIINNVEL